MVGKVLKYVLIGLFLAAAASCGSVVAWEGMNAYKDLSQDHANLHAIVNMINQQNAQATQAQQVPQAQVQSTPAPAGK
jgi:hypothetical protein